MRRKVKISSSVRLIEHGSRLEDPLGRRVDRLEEREAVEIGVARIDPLDPVLPHQTGCLGIIEKVAA